MAGARTLLAAEVARSYIALAQAGSAGEIAAQTLTQRLTLARITLERVQAGLDTRAEVALADARVADARTQLLGVAERQTLLRHQLAALSAQAPQALATLAPTLAELTLAPSPAAPNPPLGADLLGRRADLAAARARVEAATQGVALARGRYYPDLNLNVFAGLSALGLDKLVDLGSRTYGAGPALRLPLFDAPGLHAQLGSRAAEVDAAVAAYNAAVIDAARSAADALALRAALAGQITQQADALAQADEAWRIARTRYDAGLSGYLQVLATDDLRLAQARAASELRARALDAQVQLMHALGGGWDAAELGAAPTAVVAPATTAPPASTATLTAHPSTATGR
jgi:NodT family efflux transporter outer membrane factor (OMF) lipoprotein